MIINTKYSVRLINRLFYVTQLNLFHAHKLIFRHIIYRLYVFLIENLKNLNTNDRSKSDKGWIH